MAVCGERNNLLEVPHEGTPMRVYEDIIRSSIDSKMGNFGAGMELENRTHSRRSNSVQLWLNSSQVEEWSFTGDY